MYWVGAHWRNLANTTEPSMCGGDEAFLSNYSLTICYYYFTTTIACIVVVVVAVVITIVVNLLLLIYTTINFTDAFRNVSVTAVGVVDARLL